MLELTLQTSGRATAIDPSTRDLLKNSFYGTYDRKELELSVEETLYLLDMRNAACAQAGRQVSFNQLASRFWKTNKFVARYFTYKDWRDRGLVAIIPGQHYSEPNQTTIKKYPSSKLRLPSIKLHGAFYKTDFITMLEEEDAGKELYEKFWFGQYGSYKASEKGKANKLDIFEAQFLIDEGKLELTNMSNDSLAKLAGSRRKEFPSLYDVYRDWREKGYVVKTGFKFGTHFRLYFPGAKPMKAGNGDWTHSKHVIHVFPKSSRLLISEWARAIRVAHSVRKTFILAVPGKTSNAKQEIDYVLYHRHGGEADNPNNSSPKYAMLSLSEDEYIGGQELAGALDRAKRMRLELLLAIADRETAVTYYHVKQIKLQGSENDYFEIDWLQP